MLTTTDRNGPNKRVERDANIHIPGREAHSDEKKTVERSLKEYEKLFRNPNARLAGFAMMMVMV